MKNFPVKVNGKEYWISRSVATVGFVFKRIGNTIYALVEQRGIGAADNIHSYCAVCGYLDYDETAKECIAREMAEECGFKCNLDKLKMVAVNTNPKINNQNVTLHYVYNADESEDFNLDDRFSGEENEVENVEWLPVATIYKDKINILNENIDNRKWAFNHENLIKKYVLKHGT